MIELAVPNVNQKTNYTCGPASLLAVFRYLRIANRASERSLAKEMGTTVEGTDDQPMLDAARKRWAMVTEESGLNHLDLIAAVNMGDVLILGIQAWTDTEPKPRGFVPSMVDGHYVVLTGADDDGAVFMDPASRCRRWLPRRELRYRWVDAYGGRVIYGWAMRFAGVRNPRRRTVRWSTTEQMG